jgi:GNAT superfamily N-acetyltransferase
VEAKILIREEPLGSLTSYAEIPIAFTVKRIVDASIGEAGEFSMVERAADTPTIKDYDAFENPRSWIDKLDTSNWGVIAARSDNRRVGGAVIALRTSGLDMLEGRSDLAVLWDIRVHPEMRDRGIGSALLEAAELWTLARGCKCLKVETQNINADACHFYARRGFILRAINEGAYPSLPDETQLLWYKDLR